MGGAAVPQRRDAARRTACRTRYHTRYALATMLYVVPLLGLLGALLAFQSGTLAMAIVGWFAIPGAALFLAVRLGAFAPGVLGGEGRPRFHQHRFQHEYDAANR